MTQGQLRDRAIAISLAKLSGKLSVREIADHLESEGFLQVPEDLVEQYRLERTRKMIQASRRYKNPENTGRIHFVSLVERDENNAKNTYYKKIEECNWDEAHQHLGNIDKNKKYWDREYSRCLRIFSRIHGEEFQLRLNGEEAVSA